MNSRNEIEILEFKSEYKDQTIHLIDTILKELAVTPNNNIIIDDKDLFDIPSVYSGKGKFWIALIGNRVVGTVAIRDLGTNSAKLNRMFVASELRGSGLGQSLLEVALNHAKEKKFKEVLLDTHYLMKRAHRFYEKNGFKKMSFNQEKYSYTKSI